MKSYQKDYNYKKLYIPNDLDIQAISYELPYMYENMFIVGMAPLGRVETNGSKDLEAIDHWMNVQHRYDYKKVTRAFLTHDLHVVVYSRDYKGDTVYEFDYTPNTLDRLGLVLTPLAQNYVDTELNK